MRHLSWTALAAATVVLSACGTSKPKPAELGPNVALIAVGQAWSSNVGPVQFPLQVHVVGDQLWLASSAGDVVSLDGASGRELGRVSLKAGLVAGVGSDGKRAAVVTEAAQLVVVEGGKEIWRRKLGAQTYTAPLVAGGRVFVLGGDRSVRAYDGASGQLLWDQESRQQDPLVLRQSGLLMPVGNTLLVGQGGRMTAMDPGDGHLLWEAPVATPRGANDVEKLADLIAPVARDGTDLCVRAFQASVGCVDAATGQIGWTKSANGATGVAMDEDFVFGAEADGVVQAWSRKGGENRWSSSRLRYRQLSAPLVLGRSVVFGDNTGLVHMLSRADGSPLNRLSTDGSPIVAAPVRVAGRLVVVTQKGGVFAFQPQ
ncbi:outer membrane protein assembly factor BamB [Comamonas serinivorans]